MLLFKLVVHLELSGKHRFGAPDLCKSLTMSVEIYAASRPQAGQDRNNDAFLIGRGECPFAALADGAGNAGNRN